LKLIIFDFDLLCYYSFIKNVKLGIHQRAGSSLYEKSISAIAGINEAIVVDS
jgi:hypothetical protein